MKPELVKMFETMQAFEIEAQSLLSVVPGRVSSTSIEDLVDAGFLMRELSRICETLRKAFEARQGLVARFLAAAAGADALRGVEMKLEGELARAKPVVNVKPKIPDPRTADFVKLMRWLGVSDELIGKDVLRPSFSSLKAELTKRLESGEKLPPGITATFQEMACEFRTKSRRTHAASGLEEPSDDTSADVPF